MRELFPIVGGLIGGLAVAIPILIIAFLQSKKRKRLQSELTARAMSNPEGAQQPLYAVKYASEKRFKAWIKLFPWEASGVLQFAGDTVVFRGATNSGRPLEIAFAPENSAARWIGRTFINGATAWFMLERASGEKHYFTAETGTTVFGSKGNSQEILNGINAYFARPNNYSQIAR